MFVRFRSMFLRAFRLLMCAQMVALVVRSCSFQVGLRGQVVKLNRSLSNSIRHGSYSFNATQ